jgi:biopolymer transport protein ExbD
MADINTDSKDSGKKGKPKKMSTRVDLTPMVDLGFLLITFFLLATTMIKPQTLELGMPSKEKGPENAGKVKASRAVTIILDKNNKVFYWQGMQEDGKPHPDVIETDFDGKTGIRQFLLDKNKYVIAKVREFDKNNAHNPMPDTVYQRKRDDILKEAGRAKGESKTSPVVIIKATKDANYKNLIDILDEMSICNVAEYAIVDVTDQDLQWLKDAKKLPKK